MIRSPGSLGATTASNSTHRVVRRSRNQSRSRPRAGFTKLHAVGDVGGVTPDEVDAGVDGRAGEGPELGARPGAHVRTPVDREDYDVGVRPRGRDLVRHLLDEPSRLRRRPH